MEMSNERSNIDLKEVERAFTEGLKNTNIKFDIHRIDVTDFFIHFEYRPLTQLPYGPHIPPSVQDAYNVYCVSAYVEKVEKGLSQHIDVHFTVRGNDELKGCSPADAERVSKEILKRDQKRKKGEETILNRNKRRQTSGMDRRGDQMTKTEKEAKGIGIGYTYMQRLLIAFTFLIAGLLLGLFLTELFKGGTVIMQICFCIGLFVMMLLGTLAILED